MNRYLCLLVIAIAGVLSACTPQNGQSRDLGNASSDLAMAPDPSDLSMAPDPSDLGMSPDPSDLLAADGPLASWTALNLVAGGFGGPGTADDTGALARFSSPCGVTTDGAGNLYVSDNGFNASAIRKIVLATGAVSTLAGSSDLAGSADGIGSAARFNSACGLFTDTAGNLYVADSNNNTIRKVVLATGMVTTIAGKAGASGSADGMGAAAQFNHPHGVVWDGAGNLYVTDSSNSTVRKVELATGTVSTIAGTAGMSGSTDGSGTAARFKNPYGVAIDKGAATLYISDSTDNTIRMLVLATAAVTTVAGSAGMSGSVDGIGVAARFDAPHGISADSAGNLYVADGNNSLLRKIVLSTGAVTTIAGSAGVTGSADGTSIGARFNIPDGVSADGAGNLYIADTGNSIIRKVVLSTAAVTTLAGSALVTGSVDGIGAAARFNLTYGVTADSAGNLYVADALNSTIRKVVLSTGAVSTLAGTAGIVGSADGTGPAASFKSPYGLATDGAGNLYVADTGNSTIRQVVLKTGEVSTIAGTAGMFGSADGTGSAALFDHPLALATDGAGNLYVSDGSNYTVRQVVLKTGVVSTIAGKAGMSGNDDGIGAAARFAGVYGLAADGAGTLYLADTGNSTIRQLTLPMGAVSTIAGSSGMSGNADGIGPNARFAIPYGVTMGGAGILYVADTRNSTIRQIALATRSVTTVLGVAGQAGVQVGPTPARLNYPGSLVVSPTGGLIIASLAENVIVSAH